MVRRRETIEEQMARAKQNQKAATVRTSASSRGVRTRSRSATAALIASVLAALWAATMLTGAGQTAYAYGFFFTEFFAGVIALVSLSLTVMLGLLATDRLVLRISHRVLMQSAHRATGVLGVAGLGFHVLTKIATGRAAATDALVPFVGGRGLYVGLGTVAALLMVSVIWTGIIRARFAGVGPKWLWRALHSTAYLSWPFAVLHGLNAGRAAAPWVAFSYLGCILLVVLALLVRLSVTIGRRSREQHQAAVRNAAMAARAGEESRGRSLLAGLGRRRDSTEDKRPAWAEATTATWTAPPGARRRDPERFTVPVVPEPGSLAEPARPSRRRDEEPAARRDTERSTRGRRDEVEPTTRRSSRRGAEETVTRRRDEEELEPVTRRRGRAAATGTRRRPRPGADAPRNRPPSGPAAGPAPRTRAAATRHRRSGSSPRSRGTARAGGRPPSPSRPARCPPSRSPPARSPPARSRRRRAAAAVGTAPTTTCRRSRTTGARRPGTCRTRWRLPSTTPRPWSTWRPAGRGGRRAGPPSAARPTRTRWTVRTGPGCGVRPSDADDRAPGRLCR
ncbi:CPBP family intramembrane glutamic endopeptidase [Micromonospora parastrephiae]|uniref:CPBP family intramembrane glutamic endopeptidase n=1 Tax=Micromonospora parastrephiae TaxID=2806101 RepID=UPI001EE4D5A8|nr:CPBP family intramembrane glutamic endopeptidase [Micromonospora parastrephiae]